MRPSLRFLALTVLGWAGFRAATLGVLPGAEVFRVSRSEAQPPPITPTEFPPIEPLAAAPAGAAAGAFDPAAAAYAYPAPPAVRQVAIPVYYAASSSTPDLPVRRGALRGVLPVPAPQFYSPIPALDEWPLSRIAAASMPQRRSAVVIPAQSTPAAMMPSRLDRLQVSAWALLRSQKTGVAGSRSLATTGSLGASQAGARLTYNFTRQIAATFRSSSEIGRRGGEIAGGVRVQPFAGLPLWIDAERRQRIGRFGGGRSAFALFLEGGLYDRPMFGAFRLDAYLQGGLVGFRRRDKFVDGGLTLTRPVYKQFSAGLGVWGGAQPGIYRVDAGPRLTMKVRNNLRVHLDYRQRLVGNARPGSGPAVTLAGDF